MLILFACCLMLVCGVLSKDIYSNKSILYNISQMTFLGFPYKYIVAFCIVIISIGIGSYLNLFDIAAFIKNNKRLFLYSILFTIFILIPVSIQISLAHKEKQFDSRSSIEYRSSYLDLDAQSRGERIPLFEDVLKNFIKSFGRLPIEAEIALLTSFYIDKFKDDFMFPEQRLEFTQNFIHKPMKAFYAQENLGELVKSSIVNLASREDQKIMMQRLYKGINGK